MQIDRLQNECFVNPASSFSQKVGYSDAFISEPAMQALADKILDLTETVLGQCVPFT